MVYLLLLGLAASSKSESGGAPPTPTTPPRYIFSHAQAQLQNQRETKKQTYSTKMLSQNEKLTWQKLLRFEFVTKVYLNIFLVFWEFSWKRMLAGSGFGISRFWAVSSREARGNWPFSSGRTSRHHESYSLSSRRPIVSLLSSRNLPRPSGIPRSPASFTCWRKMTFYLLKILPARPKPSSPRLDERSTLIFQGCQPAFPFAKVNSKLQCICIFLSYCTLLKWVRVAW